MIKLLFKIRSFKTKIITIIVSISFLVLSVASISLGWVLDKNFKQNLDESARSSLSILAYNLAPAVSFNDEEGVSQILASFRTSADVVNATVYQLDENKNLVFIGDYSTNEQYRPIDNVKDYLSLSFIDTHYKLLRPIKVEDETIGYIYQHAIFDRIHTFHTEMINTISTIFLLCLLFSVLISLKLQKILLKPLSHLIKTTQEIRYKKDYSIRVKQISDDEFFSLAVSFNHMLDEIDNQYKKQLLIEEEVRQLNLFLEDKVNARTIELKMANEDLITTLEELEQSKHLLVEQEKMASLGALVAGIAHEINTPVGIGVTAIS
jgi:signal transduction histidine kinase